MTLFFGYLRAKNELSDAVFGDASYKNNLYRASLESGYRFGDALYFTPSIKLNLNYGSKLNIETQKLSLASSKKLFANLDTRINLGAELNHYISSSLALGYSLDLTSSSNMDIKTSGLSFVKNTKKDKRFLIELNSLLNISGNLQMILDYERSFGGLYNTAHNFSASFRYKF